MDTPFGRGYIAAVRGFHDKIRGMDHESAATFSRDVHARYGRKAHMEWCEAFVNVGKTMRWLEAKQLKEVQEDDGKKQAEGAQSEGEGVKGSDRQGQG